MPFLPNNCSFFPIFLFPLQESFRALHFCIKFFVPTFSLKALMLLVLEPGLAEYALRSLTHHLCWCWSELHLAQRWEPPPLGCTIHFHWLHWGSSSLQLLHLIQLAALDLRWISLLSLHLLPWKKLFSAPLLHWTKRSFQTVGWEETCVVASSVAQQDPWQDSEKLSHPD